MSKADIECLEESRIPDPYSALSSEDREFMERYEGEPGRAVVRKVDYRLVPIMGLLYLLSHIDRGNIGNAKIEGMDKDLGLVGNQYNIASTIFFVPYIIFEIPSNIVLKKVRPSLWLSFLVLSWGTVMTLMGVVKDFQGMVICRVFLGLCEAGFFPGAVYIVSTWYPRYELQQRLAIFLYVGVVLAQIGIYPLLPGITAWIGNNLAPSWKRSIGIAWLLAAGNLGSIIGTNVFLDKEGPRYPTGYGTSLGIICLGLISAFVLEFFLWSSNKKKSQRSEAEIRQQYSQEQLDRLGEKSPLYQYTL